MKILGKELTFNSNKVYHTGNKPTASEIGAATSSSVGTLSSLKTSAKGNLDTESVFSSFLNANKD